MVDFVSRDKRGNIMRGSRSKNTKPEMAVRRLLHAMNYRFQLHCKDLPGKPDIVFKSRKKAILIHGCFWHQHSDPRCPISRKPASNLTFWDSKFSRNRDRDEYQILALLEKGWAVLTLWECEIGVADLPNRLQTFLGPTRLYDRPSAPS